MSLHVESHGAGEPLLLLHGWGMHCAIWNEVVPLLAQYFRIYCVDLPGHGYSHFHSTQGGGLQQLDAIVAALSTHFTNPLNICGWSLGGLVALRWAQLIPQQPKSLALVSSTPCFTQRDNWLCAMNTATLQQFAAELGQNHAATLRRFLSLQVRGSVNERELLASLRTRLFIHGEPDLNALRTGLEILREVDLRDELPLIVQPTLVITGTRDKLTPSEASSFMAKTLPNSLLVNISRAAHTPFLSHPHEFTVALIEFLKIEAGNGRIFDR